MVLRSSLAICPFSLLVGLAQNVWELFTLRILMGAFSGFSALATALVASKMQRRSLGARLLGTGQLAGSLIDSLLGGAAADIAGS